MKHFATVTLVFFLLICVFFVECGDAIESSFTRTNEKHELLMQFQTLQNGDQKNPIFEVGGETYLLKGNDRDTVFKYNKRTNQWEPIALFH